MTTDPIPYIRPWSGSPYRGLEEFFAQNGVRAQLFHINPLRRTTIIGERGIRLTFFPFSICDVFGKPVREEVEIRLVELNSRPEMILSNKVTTSEDRLLESAGQFFIQATLHHLPLELCHSLAIELPAGNALRNPLALRLYEGSTATTRSFSAERAFDWKPVDQKPIKVRKLGGRKYFSFEVTEFNWFSCNYAFAPRAGRTMLSVKTVCPVSEFDDQAALIVFRDINAVARMYPAGNKFTLFNVPVNVPATVLTLGLHQGRLYYGQAELERTSGQLVHVGMQPVREADLVQAIRGL